MEPLTCNVHDTALIFEGGGMRASYTSAVVVALLRAGLHFSHVYGVSAGSSNAVNYASRDEWRSRASFTTFAADPRFGGVRTFLRHQGAFNAHFIYQEAGLAHEVLPFDMNTFLASPVQVTVSALERDTGATRLFTKDDMRTVSQLMACVRASSTLPVAMPPVRIGGRAYYDGGLAAGNGLLLDAARDDGFRRFLVVRTRPRGYRKPARPNEALLRFFWRRPHVAQALLAWGPGYNAVCDELEQLEAEGSAYVFYAEDMAVESSTTDVSALLSSYAAGEAQIARDLPAIREFLGV